MLQTKIGPFNGKTWEDLCQLVFKRKYDHLGYQQIVASLGDFGLEGFTLRSGLGFQCYCPEKHYEATELYNKQRDKITTDVGKLRIYATQIAACIGDVKIRDWHFVTPEVDRNALLAHARTKEDEVRAWNLPDSIDEKRLAKPPTRLTSMPLSPDVLDAIRAIERCGGLETWCLSGPASPSRRRGPRSIWKRANGSSAGSG